MDYRTTDADRLADLADDLGKELEGRSAHVVINRSAMSSDRRVRWVSCVEHHGQRLYSGFGEFQGEALSKTIARLRETAAIRGLPVGGYELRCRMVLA